MSCFIQLRAKNVCTFSRINRSFPLVAGGHVINRNATMNRIAQESP